MRLLLPVPPAFTQTLGYTGSRRFAAFYWIPVGDELMYTAGQISGTGDSVSWLLWTRHRAVAPALLGVAVGSSDAEAAHWLLLDRQEACFYLGTAHAVAHFLHDQPEAQALRTAWERLSPDEQKRWLTDATMRLHPSFQSLSTLRQDDLERCYLERCLLESHQRYHHLEAWLERQPVPRLRARRPGRGRVT